MDGRSRHLRKLIVRAMSKSRQGHIGSAFSIVEILRVLFDEFLKFDPKHPRIAARDRFILSKGHGCLALYALLHDKGFLQDGCLDNSFSFNAALGGHPEFGIVPGVEASTGALGHGLPMAVGIALAGKLRKLEYRTYVLVGDGELNEGSNWEAALHACKHKLSDLTIIVDCNGQQCFGECHNVVPPGSWASKLQAFGIETIEVNGHDVKELRSAFAKTASSSNPSAIVCQTSKGYGSSLTNNNPKWHYVAGLSDDDLSQLLSEL